MAEKEILRVEGLNKYFGDHHVLKDINMRVRQGEHMVIFGPSGSGKSTLLRCMNLLEEPQSGYLYFLGKDYGPNARKRKFWQRGNGDQADPLYLRTHIGMVFQQFNLFPHLNALDNVTLALRRNKKMKRSEANEKALQQLKTVGLSDKAKAYPSQLSGGQQQRIGVARCLAADPDILLMDEPFGAIDPINRDEIQDEFLKVQQTLKKTIAFVTHDIHEAIKMSDKIAIFHEGRLIQYDTPARILMEPANQYIANFVGADRALKLLGLLRAREAMSAEPVSVVDEAASAEEIEKRFNEKPQDHMVVTREGKLVRHLARKSFKLEREQGINLAEPSPHAVEMDDNLRDVLSKMLLHDRKELPVIDDNGILRGTIDYDDVHRCIMKIYFQNSESE